MAASLSSKSCTFKEGEICWNNFILGVNMFNVATFYLVVLFPQTAWLAE